MYRLLKCYKHTPFCARCGKEPEDRLPNKGMNNFTLKYDDVPEMSYTFTLCTRCWNYFIIWFERRGHNGR